MLNYAKLCVFVALNGNTCSSDLPDAAVPLPQHLHTAPSLACCLWAVPVLLVPYSTFVRVRKGKGALVCGDPSSLERQNKILGACQQVTSLYFGIKSVSYLTAEIPMGFVWLSSGFFSLQHLRVVLILYLWVCSA